jgi:hypothetical protein
LLLAGGSAQAVPDNLPPPISWWWKGRAAADAVRRWPALSVYEGLQLGDEPVGPKRFEGDERTPEGRYTIDYGNDRSAYHLSLHISYPGPADVAFAKAQGRSPGGLIFLHGQPNALPMGRVPATGPMAASRYPTPKSRKSGRW